MTTSARGVLEDALGLSERERAELAVRLLASLDHSNADDVADAWAAEIERRCAAIDAGAATTTDWHDVRRRVEVVVRHR